MTAVIISLIIFIAYNVVINILYNKKHHKDGDLITLLPSLSDSFYFLNEYKRGLGYLFTLLLWVVVFSILPQWMNVTNDNLQFLVFISAGALIFVGAAPLFKLQDKGFHQVFAIVCAVAAIAWELTYIVYIPLILVTIAIGIASISTKTLKSNHTYWLEMIAFLSIYFSLIAVSL